MARHLAEYLEASAARYPLRTAVVDSAGESLTYAELDSQSSALASFLASRGIGRGDRVGLVLPKGLAAVVSIFGVLKAGAAYVPVDATAPTDRSRRILTDCAIRALIVGRRMPRRCPGFRRECGVGRADHRRRERVRRVERHVMARCPDQPDQPDSTRSTRPTRFDPSDLAYILYTSGSTGMPKGAMITHANALSFIDWCSETFAPTPDDRFSNHAPFHFDSSVLDIYVSIKHGA